MGGEGALMPWLEVPRRRLRVPGPAPRNAGANRGRARPPPRGSSRSPTLKCALPARPFPFLYALVSTFPGGALTGVPSLPALDGAGVCGGELLSCSRRAGPPLPRPPGPARSPGSAQGREPPGPAPPSCTGAGGAAALPASEGESGELLPRDPGSGSGRKGRAGAGAVPVPGGAGGWRGRGRRRCRRAQQAEGRQGAEPPLLRAGALDASGAEEEEEGEGGEPAGPSRRTRPASARGRAERSGGGSEWAPPPRRQRSGARSGWEPPRCRRTPRSPPAGRPEIVVYITLQKSPAFHCLDPFNSVPKSLPPRASLLLLPGQHWCCTLLLEWAWGA
ncbi:cytoplasmic protein NCK2 isoform X2 [Columba livia]|uniref:cytoplasmic protein NCK2 isoform X2 n=1 Tax=Columba livia TaxID=8932 RepID=UPI0031BBB6C7